MFEANLSYRMKPYLKNIKQNKELNLNEMSSPASIHYENMSTDF